MNRDAGTRRSGPGRLRNVPRRAAAGIELAAEALADGDVVAFTGAGLSADSGIPTFRDRGGMWDRFDPEEMGTWEGMARTAMHRPEHLARFLTDLRRTFGQARPNPGHLALAELEHGGVLRGVVTQNVDGLHQEAGSARVVELHGSLTGRVCLSCGGTSVISRAEFLSAIDRTVIALRSAFVVSLAAVLPRCAVCGAPARPDFVMFGEAVKGFDEAERLVRRSKALLVVGTSGEVHPAAGLIGTARRAGAVVVVVGPGPDSIRADVRVRARAYHALPALARSLRGGGWRGSPTT